jgi:transposase
MMGKKPARETQTHHPLFPERISPGRSSRGVEKAERMCYTVGMQTEERIAELENENAELREQLTAALAHLQEIGIENTELREQLAAALARLQELERQKQKDSHNSSKPPSSDGLGRRTHSQRKPSGKESGGQTGHQGQTLSMKEKPDHTTPHVPKKCEHCGTGLGETAGRVVERRQVWDLPPIKVEVWEHQVQEISCPQCGHLTRGTFPKEVTAPVQYGAGVKAWAVYLNQYHLVPMERTCEILSTGLGCPISEGTLSRWVMEASQRLEEVCERIKQALKASRLLHEDETGVHKGKKGHWFHVSCTRFLTYLAWHQKRGREAIEAIGILPGYLGRIMRDRWSSYDHYTCAQSICGAHLLRDVTRIWELFKQKWGRVMHRLLCQICHVAQEWRARGAKRVPKEIRDRLVARYFHILVLGYAAQPPPAPRPAGKRGRMGQTEPKNLLDALLHRADQILACLDDLSIPFTNNQAERDLRMVKVQQKVSGTFRTDSGMTAFCRIRSYLSTMRKQARPLLPALAAVFSGQPFPIALSFG